MATGAAAGTVVAMCLPRDEPAFPAMCGTRSRYPGDDVCTQLVRASLVAAWGVRARSSQNLILHRVVAMLHTMIEGGAMRDAELVAVRELFETMAQLSLSASSPGGSLPEAGWAYPSEAARAVVTDHHSSAAELDAAAADHAREFDPELTAALLAHPNAGPVAAAALALAHAPVEGRLPAVMRPAGEEAVTVLEVLRRAGGVTAVTAELALTWTTDAVELAEAAVWVGATPDQG